MHPEPGMNKQPQYAQILQNVPDRVQSVRSDIYMGVDFGRRGYEVVVSRIERPDLHMSTYRLLLSQRRCSSSPHLILTQKKKNENDINLKRAYEGVLPLLRHRDRD